MRPPLPALLLLLLPLTLALPTTHSPPCLDELADFAVTPTSNFTLWNATHRVMNPDYDGKSTVSPSFVALPRNSDDVARALKCANREGIRVAAKGGGHSFGGYGTIPANLGFQLNFAHMNAVSPVAPIGRDEKTNEERFAVKAEAGARWIDVYQKFRASGENWVVTGGLCPSVGIVGFTLGGGTGPSARLHGLAIDSVLNFTLVDFSGENTISASESENPDLFWALRGGGGGNFGVVTEMTLKVFPGPDLYSWGTLCWEWKDVESVMGALAKWEKKIARTVNVDVILSKDGGICLWVIAMEPLNSTRSELNAFLSDITSPSIYSEEKKKQIIAPISDSLQETDCWWEMIASFAVAHGYSEYDDLPFYSRNCLVDYVQPGLIEAMVAYSNSSDIPELCGGDHHLISFGGKVGEVASNATAFPWRTTQYMVYTSCSYNENDSASKRDAIAALDQWESTIGPFCNGGSYVNFIDPLGRKGAEQRYYGSNAARLEQIKQKWNPPGVGPLHFPLEVLANDGL